MRRFGWPRRGPRAALSMAAVAAVILSAAACSSSGSKSVKVTGTGVAKASSPAATPASGTGGGHLTFYMITHACPSDTFWPPVFNGANAAAKAYGVTLHIVSLTSAQCGSIPAEVSNLQTAIGTHPNGIAVTIPSATAFSSALKQAAAAGIPVVAVNTIPSGGSSAANPYLAYVGQSNYQAGAGAGKEAVSMFGLHAGDKVAVVDHEPFNISLTQREQGIAAGLASAGIKPVDVNTSDDPSSGAATVQAYVTKNPDVKVLMSLGTIGTTQIVTGLKAASKSTQVKVSGFDLDSATVHYLQQGVMGFTVNQQPFLQGYYSVVELYLHDRYGAQPEDISTGPAYLTSTNIKTLGKYVNETGY
jgi:simple sugar transport system substrate-binding protein